MHINDMNSNNAIIFKDTLTALSLTQHVTTSTHAKDTILDLILTEEASNIKFTSCQVGPFLPDHKFVSAVLNVKKPPIEKKSLSVHKLHKLHCIMEEGFKSAFSEDAIDLTSPADTVLHQFNGELCKALDTIAPLKVIQVAVCQRQPWFWWDSRQSYHDISNLHSCTDPTLATSPADITHATIPQIGTSLTPATPTALHRTPHQILPQIQTAILIL